jgi:hypothetical protein
MEPHLALCFEGQAIIRAALSTAATIIGPVRTCFLWTIVGAGQTLLMLFNIFAGICHTPELGEP